MTDFFLHPFACEQGSSPLNTSATQVPEVCTSLNSDDCFVLVTPGTVFCWEGSGCTADESAVATNVATILAGDFLGTGGRAVVSVKEGSEPEEFWNTLGGKGEYAQHAPGEMPPADPRLFWCSTATGTFKVEEVGLVRLFCMCLYSNTQEIYNCPLPPH